MFRRVLSAAVLCLVMAACGDDGDTGPAGPEGPAGPQGPAGPEGGATAPVNEGIVFDIQSEFW